MLNQYLRESSLRNGLDLQGSTHRMAKIQYHLSLRLHKNWENTNHHHHSYVSVPEPRDSYVCDIIRELLHIILLLYIMQLILF